MKYRMLNAEERKIFDEDFKAFLITNGVHAEEWAEMNEKEVEKATGLVEMFSDIVFDTVYQKIEFIEFRSKDSCLVFRCKPDEMELISIVPKDKEKVDLSTPESIHETLVNKAEQLSIFLTSKKYTTLRELEIHQMIEQGCVNSSKEFWEALEKVIQIEKK
jgi:hypothetical protein